MWPFGLASLIMAAVAVSMLIWAVCGEALLRRRRLADTMAQVELTPVVTETPIPLSFDVPDRAATITRLIGDGPWSDRLQLELLRAGWVIRASEFLAYSALAALVVGSAVIGLCHTMIMGALAVPATYALAWSLMRSSQSRRNRTLSAQLPDALDMLCSSLRAGFSLAQGLKRVQTQSLPPLAQEFQRTLEEVQLGRSLTNALDGMVARTANYDLTLLVSATQTQLEAGGNMAELVGKIAAMIRERVKLQGEVAVSTAEGRLSTTVLIGLPIAMTVLLYTSNPTYLSPLATTIEGRVMAVGAVVLLVIGAGILQRLTCVKV